MKTTLIITLLLGTLVFTANAVSSDKDAKVDEDKKEKMSSEVKEKKKKRRKKVLMCNECGKPESECECEGHNH